MTDNIETRSDELDDPVAEITPALEDLGRAVEEARAEDRAAIASLTARLAAIETRANRPAPSPQPAAGEDLDRRAFAGYLRHGREALGADEVRTLRVADDTAGGYLAPPQFIAEVLKGVTQINPIRQLATVSSTASGSVTLPKRTGKPTGAWVDENETASGTESTYGQTTINVRDMRFYVDVSQRLLEDAAVNVESEVSMDAAEEAGRLEAYGFLLGDGAKSPLGLMNDTGIGYSANGHATTLQADGLITLMYSMYPEYRNSGTWLMNGTTLATIRKLKDGQNNYLWQPAYTAGQPETILGRPVVEAPDMPDIGSGTYPILFGNFARAFRIYDRLQLAVMRDPYSLATSGKVRFHFRRRVGAGVVLAEALKKLKMATS